MRQADILKGLASLQPKQRELIIRELLDFMNINMNETERPDLCPCCGKKTSMIKKGFNKGKQRYQCNDCLKIFTYDSKTITSRMKISTSTFKEILIDTLNCVALRTTAARLNISVQTVFNNRHKILIALEALSDDDSAPLKGTIEIDETFILESQKGCRDIQRKARHRGEPSNYRGLSHEQVCIVTTTDRIGHEIFKAVGFGKPTTNSILETFAQKLVKKSIIYCDGTFTYDQLATSCECWLVQLKDKSQYNEVEHINTVNYIHSMIKSVIRNFRGIATKYMNRYLALFVFIRRFQGMDDNEKQSIMVNELKSLEYTICHRDLKKYNLALQ